jgi:hypothetical protein
MSPTQTLSEASTVNWRLIRLGAIGSSWVAVGDYLETSLAADTDAVLEHQRLQPLLANTHALVAQLAPYPLPAVCAKNPSQWPITAAIAPIPLAF